MWGLGSQNDSPCVSSGKDAIRALRCTSRGASQPMKGLLGWVRLGRLGPNGLDSREWHKGQTKGLRNSYDKEQRA